MEFPHTPGQNVESIRTAEEDADLQHHYHGTDSWLRMQGLGGDPEIPLASSTRAVQLQAVYSCYF